MKIKEFNGLNVILNKQLELMLALHAVYLDDHKEMMEEFDFIETPHITYFNELKTIINSVEHQSIINDLIEFKDESECIEIALSLNDSYELDYNSKSKNVGKFLGNVNLNEFLNKFKEYAISINWDKFYDNHINFYIEIFKDFYTFPQNLNLNDIHNYYGIEANSYNYIPSILMNGGFGVSDINNNSYYIRGFCFEEETKSFKVNLFYITECLFHEFSHPIVNPLVDKYFGLFTNIDKIYEYALNNDLPKAYSSNPKVLLYEYFVRCNSKILNNKYYPKYGYDNWILTHGFKYLPELTEYTLNNKDNYETYEEFFKNDLINYTNNLLVQKLSK